MCDTDAVIRPGRYATFLSLAFFVTAGTVLSALVLSSLANLTTRCTPGHLDVQPGQLEKKKYKQTLL